MTETTYTRRSVIQRLCTSAVSVAAGPALAQATYPNRPIKVIVPWAAGGGGDVIVRMMAPSLSQRLGQPLVVENRPGAIGSIGSLAAARSPADGYTLLYGAADSHSIAPHVLKRIPYDARKDFVALAPIGYPPLALTVHASHPARTFAQFLQLTKESKVAPTFGSWGQGSSGHITMEEFKRAAGVKLLHVPYNGTAPLAQAQLANQVDCSINTLPVIEQHVRTGALRLLALTAKQRIAQFPDVPVMKEMGIGIDMGPWLGFLAPAGVPADIVTRLHDVLDATLREPVIVAQLNATFMVIDHMEQRTYQQFYISEFERWGQYIRAAGVTVDG